MSLGLKDALDLYEKVETRVNAYWTYWSVVIIAIAGWLFSKSHEVAPWQHQVVMAGVSAFFLANLSVIFHATRLAQALWNHAAASIQGQEDLPALAPAFRSGWRGRLELTVGLHATVDTLVLVLLARSS